MRQDAGGGDGGGKGGGGGGGGGEGDGGGGEGEGGGGEGEGGGGFGGVDGGGEGGVEGGVIPMNWWKASCRRFMAPISSCKASISSEHPQVGDGELSGTGTAAAPTLLIKAPHSERTL